MFESNPCRNLIHFKFRIDGFARRDHVGIHPMDSRIMLSHGHGRPPTGGDRCAARLGSHANQTRKTDNLMSHNIQQIRNMENQSLSYDHAKSRFLPRALFAVAGVALCMGATSCITPYDAHGGGSVAISSYSPGYRVTSLPGGYRRESIAGSTYYYHNGHYYRQGSGGYVVVEAPRRSRYYDDYSRYQRSDRSDWGDRRTSSRRDSRYDRGRVVNRLPRDYREVNHRGNTYYMSGEQFYRRQGSGYVVVSSPY